MESIGLDLFRITQDNLATFNQSRLSYIFKDTLFISPMLISSFLLELGISPTEAIDVFFKMLPL